jgi:hypothetical protein
MDFVELEGCFGTRFQFHSLSFELVSAILKYKSIMLCTNKQGNVNINFEN